ncbi:sensor histidine kinase [Paenibacillus sp. GCM10012306]
MKKKGVTRLAVLRQPRHWLDYVVLGIRLVWGGLGISGLHFSIGSHGVLFWLGAAGYLLSSCVPFGLYMLRNVPRYLPVAAELLITGGLFLILPEMRETVFAFFQVPFLTLGYLCMGWPTAGALLAAFFLPVLLSGGVREMPRAEFIDATANLLVLLGIGFCFQKLVHSYHKINGMYDIIQEQNATLEVYASQIESLTLAEERNRLSRDLHDTVGHTFTATIMGMDAVRYLIDVDPEEAKKNLAELLQMTRTGLDEIRQHIHGIAPEAQIHSLSDVLSQVARQFEQHTGMKVTLETDGTTVETSEQVRLVLIRCLQESLTNAKRHGAASEVSLKLITRADFITLRIEDNGRGIEGTGELIHGFGLKAMEQRVANLNGRLEIAVRDVGGVLVDCTVPVRPRRVPEIGREGA